MKTQDTTKIIPLQNGEIKIVNEHSNNQIISFLNYLLFIPILLSLVIIIYIFLDIGIPKYIAIYKSRNQQDIELGCLSSSNEYDLKGRRMYYISSKENGKILKKQILDNVIIRQTPAYDKYYFGNLNINNQYGFCNKVQFIQIKMGNIFPTQVFFT
ncbi:hypothetical protein [Alysiella filiformis]|uniref:Uncharacterized protein n=1 Tax=Alysiella filiformis DSM 16848 TaxID=1120981 RepID=A0A286ECY5_9NEIS|nr:hypothetical protein [Alysiella filiformis]QMT31913.1 hypothetical protein H3L97_03275 [Alysiella filiformis]UBQ57180.1 hypothetical protein JF568_05400 [Alysiella filiformis DSM 16848]SOD68748.1 hypothetical protein SAMN02746062_01385 [Alysiella filiformis DSM 16848]